MKDIISNKDLIEFVWRWKWVFVACILLSGVLAILFSSPQFLKPKFKSEAVVYPIGLRNLSNETSTEQLLQIVQSNEMRFRLIDTFNLYERYGIDSDDEHGLALIWKKLDKYLKFSKTPLEAVNISALDVDAVVACRMVESIIENIDLIAKSISDAYYKEQLQMANGQMERLFMENDSLTEKAKSLREQYKFFDPKKQAEEITKSYLNNGTRAGEIYDNMLKYKDEITFLDSLISDNRSGYLHFKAIKNDCRSHLDRKGKFCSIISKPFPADKKTYPVRWQILVFSVLSAIVLCYVVLALYERLISK